AIREPTAGHAAAAFAATERGRARSLLEAVEARAPGAVAAPPTGPAGRPVLAEEVLAHLPDDTALVSYWIGADRVLAFVLAGRAAALGWRPPGRAGLAGRVEFFLALPAHGAAEHADGIGRRLYRDLVAPWRGRLPQSVRRLVLVPDRVLHSLPLEALHAPADPP